MSDLPGFHRTNTEIFILVDGEYLQVNVDDLRLLEVQGVFVKEYYIRIPMESKDNK